MTAPAVQLLAGWGQIERALAKMAAQAQVIERAVAASPYVKRQQAHKAKTEANLAALIAARRSLRQVTAETCTPSAPRELVACTPELVLRLHQGNAPNARQHRATTRGAAPI